MTKKIYLQLTEEDSELLNTIITKSKSALLQSLYQKTTDKTDEDNYIHYHTFSALSYMSGYDMNTFNENSDLKFDLGLTIYQKRALTNAFQDIVNSLHYRYNIIPSECERLKKVSDCITLIKSKK